MLSQFVLLMVGLPGLAQNIPLGTWRTHASYTAVHTLAVTGEEVFAASGNGFFAYDLTDNTLTTYSKLDGFSEAGIQKLAYHSPSQTLVITYLNGNIDLLRNNEITNIPTLALSTQFPDKRINHIALNNNSAYLSTNFGVIVLDLNRDEIRETYLNLGEAGATIGINGSTFTADSIFLATTQGIQAAARQTNLADFRNWRTIPLPEGTPVVSAIASRNGTVYAGVNTAGVYQYLNGNWQRLNLPEAEAGTIRNINVSNEQVLISAATRIYTPTGPDTAAEISGDQVQSPQEALYDAGGRLWVADAGSGLLQVQNGNTQRVIPNGPASPFAWQLARIREEVVVLPGGYDNLYNPLGRNVGFHVFTSGGWVNYTPAAPELNRRIPEIRDLVSATYNPFDQTLYLGSVGDGLLLARPDGTFQVLNASNSPLRNPTVGGIAITGLGTDSQRNVWMSSYGVGAGEPSLYVKRPDNTWQNYAFTTPAARFPVSLLIDDANQKWMPLNPLLGGGIWVFNEVTNASRYLTVTLGQGGLPSNAVHALATDREGQIWAGTDRGVAVFLNPFTVLHNEPVDALTPIFERRALLQNESVLTIAVDGGNRKWMGTRNGAWLFNPAGDELIHHFTTRNSPLPSDVILDILVHPETGEVFFATDRGLVSYRGTATAGTESHTSVKVFPNPVHPGFDGLVGISGLVNDAIVKITDVSGRLVYETRAQGGTAAWNVRDYRGRRATAGIYLIFSADSEGQETMVSKIAVIE